MTMTAATTPSSEIDTPANMRTSVALDQIDGIPARGTGLSGAAYTSDNMWRIGQLYEAIMLSDGPEATFTATELLYRSHISETTLTEFLAGDGASVQGNGDLEMGPSGLVLEGFIYIPPGVHEITVASDDGFLLRLGGTHFSSFLTGRGTAETTRVAEFEGGLYALDLSYFDGGGGMSLKLMIDGLPVDQSAFYKTVSDFTDPPMDTPLVAVAEYHPSYFLGEDSLEIAGQTSATDGRDLLKGFGLDDVIDGGAGDDEILGGYGDDKLMGGAGNDVLDGGFGSDLLMGGDGDDLLIARSDAGEQRIAQLAMGMPTREDPDGEVDPDTLKLRAYNDQPLRGDDILVGGAGRDTFLIAPQLNAKLEIIEKHTRADGSINWAGVAGENNELHDHWVDSFGIDIIADYNAQEDHIAVIGHTANVYVTYADTDGDGDEESIITVISNQHGNGGAHAMDLIGQVIVHGDRVEVGDITTDNGVTYGIVANYAQVATAVAPNGDSKISVVDGEAIKGYDTRGMDGDLGAVTATPWAFVENPYADQVTYGDPVPQSTVQLTRGHFDQLGFVQVAGIDNRSGTEMVAGSAADLLVVAQGEGRGLPGALGFWSLGGGVDGRFADARGISDAKAYTQYENQALLNTQTSATGPDGSPDSAMYFDGRGSFAFIENDPLYQVSQGTIALWVRPDDLSDKGVYLSKDQMGVGQGGHFRIGHTAEGELFLRMAEGHGWQSNTWVANTQLLTEGEWNHLAVSFTEAGVFVYVNGRLVQADDWRPAEGDTASPNDFTRAFLINNDEPWVLGADTNATEDNDTAQEFATDARGLINPFTGALADFGIWGGFTADDALSASEIGRLMDQGPGRALTNTAGPQPIAAGDDILDGKGGNDTIDGGGGDDVLLGNTGNDRLLGGYGDDRLEGGAGNDYLDGGRGSDLLMGGDGDDVLRSGADAGEQRIGQLVLGAPSRAFPDASVDPDLLKLVDWTDQELVADDVLVGGAGADHFMFETQINAKLNILMDHLKDDGRTIDWMGVAGENRRLHDHWVDGFGIDIIADYNAAEDRISVIGHTTQIEVSYHSIDTNGDGRMDDMVSVITAYSQQGNGGAHDEDYLGYIVVYGDRVEKEAVTVNAKAHYGIVHTIDEVQEAVAPTGDTKLTVHGQGYDSRDVDGDPIGSRPEEFSDNEWLVSGAVDLASALPDGTTKPGAMMADAGGNYNGLNATSVAHTGGQAQRAGTYAFNFVADAPGNGRYQALLSKDHAGYKDGGHMQIYLDAAARLIVRFQGKDAEEYLSYNTPIVAGEAYAVAFTFAPDGLALYVNGALVDRDDGFARGMLDNTEDLLIGASSQRRWIDDDRPEWFFDGQITAISMLDRPLTAVEALLLAEGGSALAALDPLYPGTEANPFRFEGSAAGEEMRGSGDADYMIGMAGDDVIKAVGGNDTLIGGKGDDVLRGQGGDDRIEGGIGADRLFGGTGEDLLLGEEGEDLLKGDAGDDIVLGGSANDKLYGGGGADWLEGGAGNDRLRGNSGVDSFVFREAGADNADIITDFEQGVDLIVLEAAALGVGGVIRDAVFHFGAAAETTKAQFVYDADSGKLWVDTDGRGSEAAQLIATLAAGTALDLSDFVFI